MHKYSARLKVHLRVNTLPHFQCWCSFVTAETIGRGRGSGQRIRNSALQHATGAVPSTRAITGRRRGSWTDAAMVTIYGARRWCKSTAMTEQRTTSARSRAQVPSSNQSLAKWRGTLVVVFAIGAGWIGYMGWPLHGLITLAAEQSNSPNRPQARAVVQDPNCPGNDNHALMCGLVNEYRDKHGLEPVQLDSGHP
jgi:hypothetical protein